MKKIYISPVCNCSKFGNYSCESLICTSPIHFPKNPEEPDPEEETEDNWSKRRNMYSGYASDDKAPTDATW